MRLHFNGIRGFYSLLCQPLNELTLCNLLYGVMAILLKYFIHFECIRHIFRTCFLLLVWFINRQDVSQFHPRNLLLFISRTEILKL
jgi:hypothetical protein